MRQTTLTQSRALVVLLAGSISHTSTECMILSKLSLDLATIYFPHFSGC